MVSPISSPTLLAVALRSASLATIGIGAPASSAIEAGREAQLGPAAELVLTQQRRDAQADRPP